MGLYLAVFDDGNELDGVDVGSYSDFSEFRNAVVDNLEPGGAGSRFPTLILHSDCDGRWTSEDARQLEREIEIIAAEFRRLPARSVNSGWQVDVAKALGLSPSNLFESFFDVDGQPLLARLRALARLSRDTRCPILFQ